MPGASCSSSWWLSDHFIEGNSSFSLHRPFIYAMTAAATACLAEITGAVAAHVLLIAPSLTPFRQVSPVTVVSHALLVCYSAAFASIIFNPHGATLGLFALLDYLLPQEKLAYCDHLSMNSAKDYNLGRRPSRGD